jgi:peptidoglycan/xylan/chitin deacetylase (PgdA/CDA1 family)
VPATFFVNTAFLDGGGIAHYNAVSVLLDRLASRAVDIGRSRLERLEDILPPADLNGDTSLPKRILSLSQVQKRVIDKVAEILEVDFGRYIREHRPYLCSEQVAALLRTGFTIGAHSHDHHRYTELPLEGQVEQTRTSLEILQRRFGIQPKSFAFPYSDSGVGPAFFAAVYADAEPLLDVSFGTAGIGVPHFHPRNIERMSMEKTSAPAAQILARQFTRTAYFRLRGRSNGPKLARS